MTLKFDNSGVQLVNADALAFVKTLPDNCIDLILTDPPYFRVKPHGWDNQWSGDSDYLRWLDNCLAEFWRVLKPAGGIYLFCGHRLAADIEIRMRERFNVLNHIVWAKPSGRWGQHDKGRLRAYFPATERVLFAEHYQGPYRAKTTDYGEKSQALKQRAMTPLISYFRDARSTLGITSNQIAQATGKKNMVSHWFSFSQWQLPSETDYKKLQALFNEVARERKNPLDQGYEELKQQHRTLDREYHELVAEYHTLRRPFAVSAAVPYTDVWTYKPVQFYPGKHPCEKPAEMMVDIINASSRPGDIVADFFMGSGSAIKAALALGRRAVGVEIERERFDQTRSEINVVSN